MYIYFFYFFVYVNVYAHVYVNANVYVNVFVCIYLHTFTHVDRFKKNIYIYIYIYIYPILNTHVGVFTPVTWHLRYTNLQQGTGDCGIFDTQLVGTSGKPGTAPEKMLLGCPFVGCY